MKIIAGIHSSWKQKYTAKRELILKTWFPDAVRAGIDIMFAMGTDDAHPCTEPTRDGAILHLPCPDVYMATPIRTVLFCRWALGIPDWDYLFKCDDDTYVAAARLAKFTTTHDYVGGQYNNYASGGPGYLISRRAAQIAAEKMSIAEGYEDLEMGATLRAAGINLHNDNRFVPFGNNEPYRRPSKTNDVIGIHYATPEMIEACHRDVSGEHA